MWSGYKTRLFLECDYRYKASYGASLDCFAEDNITATLMGTDCDIITDQKYHTSIKGEGGGGRVLKFNTGHYNDVMYTHVPDPALQLVVALGLSVRGRSQGRAGMRHGDM